MTSAEAAKELLLAHMPPGAAKWMNFERGTVSSLWTAIAQSAKLYGFDYLDALRRELKGWQLTDRIADWERILSIPASAARSNDRRRAEIISRRREFGASSIPNVMGALAPVCGPTAVTILEHSRSVLTALNWYEISNLPLVIPPSADLDFSFIAHDNAPVSQAGARVTVKVTHPSIEDLSLRIAAPDGTQSDSLSFGSGPATERLFVFCWPGAAGKTIDGGWKVTITDSGAAGGTVDDPAGDSVTGLHVEGIGRDPVTGANGLGARAFEWNALIDETATSSLTYDRRLAWQIAKDRWNQAHCQGSIALKQTNGDTGAVCGDANCIVGMVVCGN
jgi:Proprotein convertase P-domain